MKKFILVLIVLILLGVIVLEVSTFIKMLDVSPTLPSIDYLRMGK